MKKLVLAAAVLLLVQVARAQKVYFIYIQSESNTPFFIKMGDKVTSATASGYLILPKLVDSAYQFTVGKTGQSVTESRFSVTINKRDRGFLLREADGKLSLFDLQGMTLLHPLASATSSNGAVGTRTDAFTVLLAQAANDPSLLEIYQATTIAQPEKSAEPQPTNAVVVTTSEPEKKAPEPPVIIKDTLTETSIAESVPEKKEPEKESVIQDTVQQIPAKESESASAVVEKPYKPSVVTRKSESSTSEGFGLVFLDEGEGSTDTIRIVIPNQSGALKKQETGKQETNDADSKKFLNITNVDTTKNVTVDAANEKISAAEKKKRNACAELATEREFLKLRKAMVAKDDDDAMIREAVKTFKKTCFSTEQIKSLSSLFLTASGKYHFFDAAYGYISNQEQYAALQTELDDTYHVNRFKALIANQ